MSTRHIGISGLIAHAAATAVASGVIGLTPAFGQTATLAVPAGDPPHSATELETLVGPIALYPDDLIGIVLPASTYPLQIVQASRFREQQAVDASLQPDDEWDNSVVALLNYPEVLELMDTNIDWTWALGEAVLAQQADVMDAIQDFRARAYEADNLQSDERQIVTQNEGVIEIAPADPEVIYIPYYEPERVVVVQPQPAYYYYANPYPVYYYPYPLGYSFGYHFGYGFFWGVTSIFDIGWHNHYVHVYHHSHYSHPYYHHTYYAPYYARHSVNVNQVTHVWRPYEHRAARPHVGHGRVVASREGYTSERTPQAARTRTVSANESRVVRNGASADERQASRPQQPQRVSERQASRPQQPQQPQRVSERQVPRQLQPQRPVTSASASPSRSVAPGNRGARSIEPAASPQVSHRAVQTRNATSLAAPARSQSPQRQIGSMSRNAPAASLQSGSVSPPRQSARPSAAPGLQQRVTQSQASRSAAPQAARTAPAQRQAASPSRPATFAAAAPRAQRAPSAQRSAPARTSGHATPARASRHER